MKDRPTTTAEDEQPGEHEEVEALSEMMCSLVTNHYGETRYIGKFSCPTRLMCSQPGKLTGDRVIIWLLHLLTKGY